MTLSHLNFFVPYENAPSSHENQLTRALLVVLRYSPMAHQAWLRLVDPTQHLHELAKAEFATQRTTVLGPESLAMTSEPATRTYGAPRNPFSPPMRRRKQRKGK
jgi:hypothetical protein